jgi:viroplasmin and RNaseH domain-containing protein
MIVYPTENYDSFVSDEDAEDYFLTRLNSDDWNSSIADNALMTAFQTLKTIDMVMDLSDTEQLKAIKQAQMEQAYHEITKLNTNPLESVSLGGLLSVKMDTKKQAGIYSERALAILKPYMRTQTINRLR